MGALQGGTMLATPANQRAGRTVEREYLTLDDITDKMFQSLRKSMGTFKARKVYRVWRTRTVHSNTPQECSPKWNYRVSLIAHDDTIINLHWWNKRSCWNFSGSPTRKYLDG